MADTQSSNAASEEYIATGVESVSEQTTSPAVSFVSEVEADQGSQLFKLMLKMQQPLQHKHWHRMKALPKGCLPEIRALIFG